MFIEFAPSVRIPPWESKRDWRKSDKKFIKKAEKGPRISEMKKLPSRWIDVPKGKGKLILLIKKIKAVDRPSIGTLSASIFFNIFLPE